MIGQRHLKERVRAEVIVGRRSQQREKLRRRHVIGPEQVESVAFDVAVRAVCHECRLVQTTVRNCTRDEGGPFEVGNQVLISSHRKLLSSKAMVVSVAETSGHDPGRQG